MARIEEGFMVPESEPSGHIEPTDEVVVEERVGAIYDELAPINPPRGVVGTSWEEEHAD
jgi:hypothetical protein